MANNDRALYFCVNVGVSLPDDVLARAQYTPFNVGVEEIDVAARSLYAPVNVGFSDNDMAARGLYAPLAVQDFSDPNDGIEVQLVASDIMTVLHNLAVK